MTERGILFSGEMVHALLDGRKTQTRRLIKDQARVEAFHGGLTFVHASSCPNFCEYACGGLFTDQVNKIESSPYGSPGDRLWVRETWSTGVGLDDQSPAEIGRRAISAGYAYPWAPLKYTVDGYEVDRQSLVSFGGAWGKTRVSIHMPRWASRITLEVVSVRVQRLQDMRAADAIAEGYPLGVGYWQPDGNPHEGGPLKWFSSLWNEINGERAPWASNPLVYAVEFKRVEEPRP